jgi:hypothetical protein
MLYTVLVVKREGKSQVGRSKHRWEYNMKMDPKENGLEKVVNDLTQNMDKWRVLVGAVKTFRLLHNMGEMGVS